MLCKPNQSSGQPLFPQMFSPAKPRIPFHQSFIQSNLAQISLLSPMLFLQFLPPGWKRHEYNFMPQCGLHLHRLQGEGREEGGMIGRMCHDPAELGQIRWQRRKSWPPVATNVCMLFVFLLPPQGMLPLQNVSKQGCWRHLISDIPLSSKENKYLSKISIQTKPSNVILTHLTSSSYVLLVEL